MELETTAISAEEFAGAERRVSAQLWNSGLAAAMYGNVIILVCTKLSGDVAGLWVCPADGGQAARRTYRLLPYASPWVDPRLHAAVRHRVAGEMLGCLLRLVLEVDLPMDPGFREAAAFLAYDVEMAFRHTRVLDVTPGMDWLQGYLSSTRNHVRAARARVTVTRTEERSFMFDRAIKGQDSAAVRARIAAGLVLGASAWPTACFSAIDGDGTCRGQVFIVQSQHSAVLLHSWFDREGPRGVPSLLVDEAIQWTVREWKVSAFDFEGSVIPGIDQFMAGFGAEAVGYAQLRRNPGGGTRTVLR
jgi:hypothetical protein